ncbi:hypothetical protein M2475_001854 [Breznakia sp. PF5-3]|uniref:hypothetical protein n=1 Tax=unclassified Breznakia TaxID=2623764 RepID=UPI00240501A9|nr:MULTISPECIES: hypothetical protein [unclassified Breznakia]MDF9825399.1 hypothetical protein [Breznakia sp. PM6-1]MDF9836277.1 hypothetical protein [Breznakia sp. PF5-3]MDF9837571.1 hypothetical protein [Breznakia sp. PFB2-8]MDF9860184.1 hypothetical protein [Breznakia sp. PH5-24]
MIKKTTRTIWGFIAVLLFFIVSTISVLADKLVESSQGDEEIISLFPSKDSTSKVKVGNDTPSSIQVQSNRNYRTSYTPVTVSDDKKVWKTQTDIEIFKLSYKNGSDKVSVLSSDGSEVIAPGTENSYTFNIKNNSKSSVKYKMTCEVFVEPENLFFPVEMSFESYTGNYLLGNSNSFVNVEDISLVEDSGVLSANNYAYYTLNWQWPFEWDNDTYDTYLGDRAVNEDLTVSVVIKTLIEDDGKPSKSGGGISSPSTGDATNKTLLSVLAIVSLGSIVVILGKKYRKV